jgi:hypothetical protein
MFAGPGRREIHWKGEYREVVAPKRLVFTVSDRPGEDGYELVVVVFSDLGDGRTEMLFQQHGRMSAKQYERAGEGGRPSSTAWGAPGRRLTPRVHLPIVSWIWMVRGRAMRRRKGERLRVRLVRKC